MKDNFLGVFVCKFTDKFLIPTNIVCKDQKNILVLAGIFTAQ